MVFFLQGLSGDDGIPGRPGSVGDRVCEKKMFMVARWGFYGQYPPSLSINYVAIIKDLEKLASRLY